MEKRTVIAVILCLLVIIIYPYYLQKYYPQKKQQQPELIEQEQAVSPVEPASGPALSEPLAASPVLTTAPEIPEEEIKINTPLMEVTFSNYNATIKAIKLWDYLDKEGNPVELVPDVPVRYRPLATNISTQTIIYKAFQEKYQVRFTSAVNGLNLTKTYFLDPESYLFKIDILLENRGLKEISFTPGIQVTVGTMLPGPEYQAQMYLGTTQLIDGKPVKTKLGRSSFQQSYPGRIYWAAVRNKYFALLLKPQEEARGITVTDCPIDDKSRGIVSFISLAPLALPGDKTHQESFLFYAGPKRYEVLRILGLDMDKVMDFGFMAPISKATLKLLNFFYRIVHNYGLAIILLTILVRFLLYPLTYKSYKSMQEMQKVQPLMQELQKKYKDDPKRLQKEMMLLYREHKVNPLGGCLPMLFQMPVLIALFTTLRSAIELRGAPFILWIKDLSEPDTLLRLPNGFPVNILPIFLIATFFVQQRMTTMPATTAQQQQQQKMMATFMPFFLGFIFYKMPSGLVLYFTLSTLLGIFDQYRIKRAVK